MRPSLLTRPVAIALTVLLAVLGSVGAVVAANADDGEASPDDAVRALLSHVADGDLLGAVSTLPPGERTALIPSLGPIAADLHRLGLTGGGPLDRVGSIDTGDLRVEELTLSSEVVGWDTARTRVTGGRLRGRLGDVPIDDRVRALFEVATGSALPEPGQEVDIDLAGRRLRFIVIREGGGWHVSLWESVAEWLRDPADPAPAWRDTPPPVGAATPELVVTDLFRATSDLDPGRAFANLPPDEAHALFTSSPLFLPSMRRDAARWIESEGFGFPPPEVTVAVEGSGSERVVRVTRFHGQWRDVDGSLTLTYEDGCARFDHRLPGDAGDGAADIVTRCDGDIASPLDESATGTRFRQVTVWAGLGRTFPTFVVLERNGKWYLSPTRTALTSLREILDGLEPDDVGPFLDRATEVARELRAAP